MMVIVWELYVQILESEEVIINDEGKIETICFSCLTNEHSKPSRILWDDSSSQFHSCSLSKPHRLQLYRPHPFFGGISFPF